MVAERADEILYGREELAGWVSGGAPTKKGEIIPFPKEIPVEHAVLIDANTFAMGRQWEEIRISLNSIGAGNYDDLIAQEGINPPQSASDMNAHAYMLSENGGLHTKANRYPSGFRSWDDEI
jgi:hypothetical protein